MTNVINTSDLYHKKLIYKHCAWLVLGELANIANVIQVNRS